MEFSARGSKVEVSRLLRLKNYDDADYVSASGPRLPNFNITKDFSHTPSSEKLPLSEMSIRNRKTFYLSRYLFLKRKRNDIAEPAKAPNINSFNLQDSITCAKKSTERTIGAPELSRSISGMRI